MVDFIVDFMDFGTYRKIVIFFMFFLPPPKSIKIEPWSAKGPPSVPRLVVEPAFLGWRVPGAASRALHRAKNNGQWVRYLTRPGPMARRIFYTKW